eukprot:3818542-Prorocentrum_lima.AAC.1
MTSSLVGSEMCIRDRMLKKIRVVQVHRLSVTASPVAHIRWKEAMKREQCCLLYTSDAADDM